MRRIPPVALLLSLFLLAACSSTGSRPPANEPEPAPQPEAESQEDDRTLAERLFGEDEAEDEEESDGLLSGADDEDDPTLWERFFGRSEETRPADDGADDSTETVRLRQEVARLEAARRGGDDRSDEGSPAQTRGPALGLVFTGDEGLQAPMLSAVGRVAGDYPLRIVTPGALQPVLTRYGCSAAQPQDCLRALAVQPGTRLLAVVTPVPGDGESVGLRFRLHDADLGIAYEPVTLNLPRTAGSPDRETWLAAADALLLHAQEHLRLTPAIVHAVSVENDRIYLNQGSALGLSAGTRLGVHTDARLVRGPAGTPAAWIPAERRGVLEVVEVNGPARAVARRISGATPSPGDYLVPVNADG